jgi:hypothetical protein
VTTEPFARRVQELRDAWVERRLVRALTTAHDYSSQRRLLETLHAWALDSCADIGQVYREGIEAWVGPVESESDGGAASFHAIIAGRTVIFLVSQHSEGGIPRWYVTATVAEAGQGIGAGPERRHGHWTRGRLEDLFLGLLSAHERSASAK